MRAENLTDPVNATVRYSEVPPQNLSRSCPEAITYMLRKSDAALAKYDAAILRYKQPAPMTQNKLHSI